MVDIHVSLKYFNNEGALCLDRTLQEKEGTINSCLVNFTSSKLAIDRPATVLHIVLELPFDLLK